MHTKKLSSSITNFHSHCHWHGWQWNIQGKTLNSNKHQSPQLEGRHVITNIDGCRKVTGKNIHWSLFFEYQMSCCSICPKRVSIGHHTQISSAHWMCCTTERPLLCTVYRCCQTGESATSVFTVHCSGSASGASWCLLVRPSPASATVSAAEVHCQSSKRTGIALIGACIVTSPWLAKPRHTATGSSIRCLWGETPRDGASTRLLTPTCTSHLAGLTCSAQQKWSAAIVAIQSLSALPLSSAVLRLSFPLQSGPRPLGRVSSHPLFLVGLFTPLLSTSWAAPAAVPGSVEHCQPVLSPN